MGKSVTRILLFVLLAGLLVALPVVSGCGGGTKETSEVIIGWLGDETGVSAGPFKEVRYGVEDYLKVMEKTNPIPGVSIKVLVYDTRLDVGRVPTGYQWLKGKGMDVLFHWSPNSYSLTLNDQKDDAIASFATTTSIAAQESGWLYAWGVSETDQGKWIAQAMVDDWDSAAKGRIVKVGYVSLADVTSARDCRKGIEEWIAANPGKMDYKAVEATSSQTQWAGEYNTLKDRDVIIFGTQPSGSATFIKEMRSRGYTGRLQATAFSFLSGLTLVKSVCGKDLLDGIGVPHAYPTFSEAEDVPFVKQIKDALYEIRPSDANTLKGGTTWVSGWIYGFVLSEAIRQAAATVGADKVDAAAIHDAFNNFDAKLPGTDIELKIVGNKAVFFPWYRMAEYSAELDDVIAVGNYRQVPGWGA